MSYLNFQEDPDDPFSFQFALGQLQLFGEFRPAGALPGTLVLHVLFCEHGSKQHLL